MIGIVVDTVMLSIRKEPKAVSEISIIVQENAEVMIDTHFVDPDWFKVETFTGNIGYVPKKFIATKKG
jgi:hypothetical protein